MVDNSLSDFLDSETVSNLRESPLSLCVVNNNRATKPTGNFYFPFKLGMLVFFYQFTIKIIDFTFFY